MEEKDKRQIDNLNYQIKVLAAENEILKSECNMFLKLAELFSQKTINTATTTSCLYTTVIQNQQDKTENLPDNSRNNFRVTSINFTSTKIINTFRND